MRLTDRTYALDELFGRFGRWWDTMDKAEAVFVLNSNSAYLCKDETPQLTTFLSQSKIALSVLSSLAEAINWSYSK